MPPNIKRLGRVVLRPVRFISNFFGQRFATVSSYHQTLAPWYYAISSTRFRREQHAVLAGFSAYGSVEMGQEGNVSLLRRNIHRLEKGLLMRPRRDLFGLDYLTETLECYEKRLSVHKGIETDPSTAWAHDVLKCYFDTTPPHETIDLLRGRFRSLPSPNGGNDHQLVPYRRDLSDPPPVGYDSLLQLAERRRSVRWFLQEPVPRDLIERALSVAAQAPTACNRQPFMFRIFDEPHLVGQVLSLPMGTAGYGQNIPAVIVLIGQQRNFMHERDRHLIYIDGALAAMSFAFALESLGLASCLINWPDVEELEAKLAKLIHLEPDERPVMLIGFGYPDPEGLVAASVKKNIDGISRYNFE